MNNIRLFGVPFEVHPLFWVVICAGALTGQFVELISLFSFVLMHELGHVLAALSFNWRVKKIMLLPFGGVADVEEWGTTTTREDIIVALAGPFVNVVMIGFAYCMLELGVWQESWGMFFIEGNIWIACFNLLPIWPLDGGKLVLAMIQSICPYYYALRITIVWSVIGIGVGLSCASMLVNPWQVVLIGCYLLLENIMAWRKLPFVLIRFLLAKQQEQSANLGRTRERTCLPNRPIVVDQGDKLADLVKMMRKGHTHTYHVTEKAYGRIGTVSVRVGLSAYFAGNPFVPIIELIDHERDG